MMTIANTTAPIIPPITAPAGPPSEDSPDDPDVPVDAIHSSNNDPQQTSSTLI